MTFDHDDELEAELLAGIKEARAKREEAEAQAQAKLQEKYTIKRKVKVGDKVLALMSANETTYYSYGAGIYQGDEVPPPGVGINLGFDLNAEKIPNPKIQLENGDIVWGCECWWHEYDSYIKALEGLKEVKVSIEDFRSGALKDILDLELPDD